MRTLLVRLLLQVTPGITPGPGGARALRWSRWLATASLALLGLLSQTGAHAAADLATWNTNCVGCHSAPGPLGVRLYYGRSIEFGIVFDCTYIVQIAFSSFQMSLEVFLVAGCKSGRSCTMPLLSPFLYHPPPP